MVLYQAKMFSSFWMCLLCDIATPWEPGARLCCFVGYGIDQKRYCCSSDVFWEHKMFPTLCIPHIYQGLNPLISLIMVLIMCQMLVVPLSKLLIIHLQKLDHLLLKKRMILSLILLIYRCNQRILIRKTTQHWHIAVPLELANRPLVFRTIIVILQDHQP